MTGTPSPPEQAMRLRAEPQPVLRLSRRVLVAISLVAGTILGAALIVALSGDKAPEMPAELFSTDIRSTADGLATLPQDYGTVPRLGPPLPGDWGRPLLDRQGGAPPAPEVSLTPVPDPVEQQRMQDAVAANASRLFVGTSARSGSPAPVSPATLAIPAVNRESVTDRHQAFLNEPVDRRTTAPDRIAPPASPTLLQAGSVIAAALLTGIRSDLPGQVAAQVTENVYDSATGRHLLIPQGSRLIGEYQGGANAGQRRVLLVWTRVIRPDGSSLVLERLPGTDAGGYTGLEDEIDDHWDRVAGAAALSSLLSIGTELATEGDDAVLSALRDGAQDTASDAGQRIVSRELSVPPTVTIRAGYPVRIVVARDLVITPYGDRP